MNQHKLYSISFFMVSFLCFSPAFSQSGKPFTCPPVSLRSSPAAEKINAAFSRYELYEIPVEEIHRQLSENTGSLSEIELHLGHRHWTLQLEKHDLRSSDYVCRVATGNGVEILPRSESSTFKGYLKNEPDSWLRFSIREGEMLGMIHTASGEYFIEPLSVYDHRAPAHQYLLYSGNDFITGSELTCGAEQMAQISNAASRNDLSAAAECKMVDIALAADSWVVNLLGSVPATETRLLDILNWVEGKFMEPGVLIDFNLTTTFISPTLAQDPWTTSKDANTVLPSFRAWGNAGGFGSAVYDVATLLTRRGMTGFNGLAYVSAVCKADRYNVVEHFVSSNTSLNPVLIPSIIMSHEIAHNFSAAHVTGSSTYLMLATQSRYTVEWDPQNKTAINNYKTNSSPCVGACMVTSLPDEMKTKNIAAQIYPNPASGQIQISYAGETPVHEIRIFNANGNEIIRRSVSSSANNIITLDVSALPAGIYQTVLVDENQRTGNARWMKD